MTRQFVIDEQINERLAEELARRGKNVVAVSELLAKGLRSGELVDWLSQVVPNCVLITGDDSIPINHPDSVSHMTIAVAVVDPEVGSDYDPDQWDAEIVHRWVHKMENLTIGAVRRYGLNGHSPWKPRRRPRSPLVQRLERQLRR